MSLIGTAIGAIIAGSISAAGSAASANAASNRQVAAQRQMTRDQALMDRWFAEHKHQMEVGDLKKAGLNPVLSATNGTATQSVSSGSASAPQGDFPDLGKTLNDAISNMNSAKAVNSQNEVNDASIGLINQQAMTEVDKRTNLQSQTEFNNLQSMGKAIENEHLPGLLKSQIKNNISSAKAGLISAYASQVGAKANMLNATEGNPFRFGVNALKNYGSSAGVNAATSLKNIKSILGSYLNASSGLNPNMLKLDKQKKLIQHRKKYK